jgi:hypothetical protein
MEFRCPKCGGEQLCPCKSCKPSHPDKVTWKDEPDDIISCGHCGLSAHVDRWLDWSGEFYKTPHMTLEEIEQGWEKGLISSGEASSFLGELSREEIERARVDDNVKNAAREHRAARARNVKFAVVGLSC